jgi:hypothetical protein
MVEAGLAELGPVSGYLAMVAHRPGSAPVTLDCARPDSSSSPVKLLHPYSPVRLDGPIAQKGDASPRSRILSSAFISDRSKE